MAAAIALEALTKSYGARRALAGIGFAVDAGEIVGLLGPNGAGKSTTLGILGTLLPFDHGRVQIAGHALPGGAAAVRRVLGLVPQRIAVYPTLSANENVRFFARGAGLGAREARNASARVLEMLGLADRAEEPVAHFSIGMQRRLNFACSIVHRPSVALLDEPTVGVDPQSRERVFEAVQGLAATGAAVLYSTHHMEEAERLCRRVVLLDAGRIVASGTPASLVTATGITPRAHLRTARPLPPGWLDRVAGARVASANGETVEVAVDDAAAVSAVVTAALRAGADVQDLVLRRPTLADAFFALTGRALRDEEG